MKDIFKVVFVIIGTLIGAGFASGQEIYTFFYSYGINGLYGILICSIFTGIVIYKVFKIINENKISTYHDLLEIFTKSKSTSNKKYNEQKQKYINFTFITSTIINIFLLITFFIMIAGFGAYFEQELGISSLIGCGILAFLCFIIFMTSVKGVVKANELLVPILIIFIIVIGIINFNSIDVENSKDCIIQTKFDSWILSSIVYCSYNSILLIPVLITLKDLIKNNKEIKTISTISGILIFILSIIIYYLLMKVDIDIKILEMPVIYVIGKFYPILKNIYGFIILASIFTTSISIGVSFLQNTARNKKSYTQIAIVMCITSIIISKIGFSNLVNLLYPIFGYLGLIQIGLILIK